MNLLFIDIETGGLRPGWNPILSISGMIEINGNVVEEFNYNVRPLPEQIIEQSALDINKITREEIDTFENPHHVADKLITLINKYSKDGKLVPCGWNVNFDINHLQEFFLATSHDDFKKLVDYHVIDVGIFAFQLAYYYKLNIPKFSLVEVAKYFDVPLEAHNAKSDIEATRAILYKMRRYLK